MGRGFLQRLVLITLAVDVTPVRGPGTQVSLISWSLSNNILSGSINVCLPSFRMRWKGGEGVK